MEGILSAISGIVLVLYICLLIEILKKPLSYFFDVCIINFSQV